MVAKPKANRRTKTVSGPCALMRLSRRYGVFNGISVERVGVMTDLELRWLDNIKKAIHDSDKALLSSAPQDHCLEELCKAIDTAKTLRRSLRGEDMSPKQNRARFIEFLDTELPRPENRGLELQLVDAREGTPVTYSFSSLVYDIRCMIHENENLNVAERPAYHLQLDWTMSEHDPWIGYPVNGAFVLNARLVCHRLREILTKFVTVIQSMFECAHGATSGYVGNPPLGSIRPKSRGPA